MSQEAYAGYNSGLLIVHDTNEGKKEAYDTTSGYLLYVTPKKAQKSHTINVGLLTVRDTKEGQKEAYNTAAGYLLYVTPKKAKRRPTIQKRATYCT